MSITHVINNSDAYPAILLGMLDNILNAFTLPNALSICTRNEAILLVSTSSILSNCLELFLGGILSETPLVSN